MNSEFRVGWVNRWPDPFWDVWKERRELIATRDQIKADCVSGKNKSYFPMDSFQQTCWLVPAQVQLLSTISTLSWTLFELAISSQVDQNFWNERNIQAKIDLPLKKLCAKCQTTIVRFCGLHDPSIAMLPLDVSRQQLLRQYITSMERLIRELVDTGMRERVPDIQRSVAPLASRLLRLFYDGLGREALLQAQAEFYREMDFMSLILRQIPLIKEHILWSCCSRRKPTDAEFIANDRRGDAVSRYGSEKIQELIQLFPDIEQSDLSLSPNEKYPFGMALWFLSQYWQYRREENSPEMAVEKLGNDFANGSTPDAELIGIIGTALQKKGNEDKTMPLLYSRYKLWLNSSLLQTHYSVLFNFSPTAIFAVVVREGSFCCVFDARVGAIQTEPEKLSEVLEKLPCLFKSEEETESFMWGFMPFPSHEKTDEK